jgi:DUF2934 family protein
MSSQSTETSNRDQLESVAKPAELTAKLSPPDPQPVPLSEQDVAELAYRRWLERGCPQGSPEEDWFEAEHDLESRSRSS